MTVGPVEYLVLSFPDGDLSDDVANELAKLVEKDAVRILDFVLLASDAFGEISVSEIDELVQMASFHDFDVEIGGLIGPEDIEFVSAGMDPDSSVAILLVEDLWATSLGNALDRTGGVLTEGARIPKLVAEAAMATLPAA
jgi:hypothetical protein